MDGLLYQAIQYGGDAQPPDASVRLRDVHRLHRLRPVAAGEQLGQQLFLVLADQLGGPLDRPAVHPRGPGVGFHLRPGLVQVLRRQDVFHRQGRLLFGAHRSPFTARGGTRLPRVWATGESTPAFRPRPAGRRPCLSRPAGFGGLPALAREGVRRSRLSSSLRPFAPPGFPRASPLLRPLLTPAPLSQRGPPRVRRANSRPVPPGSTRCVFR